MRGLATITIAGILTLAAVAPTIAQQANPCAAKTPAGQKAPNPCATTTPAGQKAPNPGAPTTPAASNPRAGKAESASPGAPSALRGPVERDSERP